MEIENLYSSPQLLQITAGNFRIFCVLATFGEYSPDKLNTSELEDRYFHEKLPDTKMPPVGTLIWPCKRKDIEQLAGEVFLYIRLILSSQNSLDNHKNISSHIVDEYFDLEKNFYNRHDTTDKSIDPASPKYTRIPYPKSSEQVEVKGNKSTYFYARAGRCTNDITPFVYYWPAKKGVAIKFDFRFNGFTAESPTELAARDALLEQICDDFMSHVDISPMPRDERPTAKTPSIDNTHEDDGW